MSEGLTYGILGIAFGIMLGALIGGCSGVEVMQKEALSHHAAHYDSQTGKWQWNDEVKP